MKFYYRWKLRRAKKRLERANAAFTLPVEEQMEKDMGVVVEWFLARDAVGQLEKKLK